MGTKIHEDGKRPDYNLPTRKHCHTFKKSAHVNQRILDSHMKEKRQL